MSRKHDQSHFFKYSSFHTAMLVIKSRGFRWSTPIKFNDPFDNQVGFVLDSNPDVFANALTAFIERLVFSDIAPTIAPTSKLSKFILNLYSIREKLPREKFLQDLHEGSRKCARQIGANLIKANRTISEYLCHSQVLCVSELHDNVVMWSHYAEQHRGVVFKLGCIDEIGNALFGARKVAYTDDFPIFPSDDEFIKHLTGEKKFDFASMCMNLAFTKHTHWAYEREWRVVRFMDMGEPAPREGYAIYPEDPRVFEAVYLGCRMEDKEAARIVECIKRYLPAIQILRGKKSTSRFALSFEEI